MKIKLNFTKILSVNLLLFLFFFYACTPAEKNTNPADTPLAPIRTENVIIAVIDGARYTETFGDPSHDLIPNIWNKLRPLGTIYTSFYNDFTTSTCSGHSCIVTGTQQNMDDEGLTRPSKPTIFEYYRMQKYTYMTDNYVVLGKSKLKILARSKAAGYGEPYAASVKYSDYEYDDNSVFDSIKEVMNTQHPKVMVINFPTVDGAGHSGDWEQYINAIKNIDTIIYQLWELIQSNPNYQNTTTLFVTNDHGRHTNDFTSHGDSCDGCRHIMLLVLGPHTPQGAEDSIRRSQTDILPTAGNILEIETPLAEGKIIETAVSVQQSNP